MPGASGSWEANPDLTMKQVAASIRQKYPDSQLYKSKSDDELVKAFVNSDTKNELYKKRIKDWPTEYPIVPKENESFQDAMKRAANAGKENLSKDQKSFIPPKGMEKEYTPKELTKKVGITLGAAAGIGVASPAILAGLGETGKRLFTDKEVWKQAGTKAWKEIEPSVSKKVFEHIKAPGVIVKTPFGRAIEYYLISKLGVSKSTLAKLSTLIGE